VLDRRRHRQQPLEQPIRVHREAHPGGARSRLWRHIEGTDEPGYTCTGRFVGLGGDAPERDDHPGRLRVYEVPEAGGIRGMIEGHGAQGARTHAFLDPFRDRLEYVLIGWGHLGVQHTDFRCVRCILRGLERMGGDGNGHPQAPEPGGSPGAPGPVTG
jgi:hypothetical protein